MVWKQDRMGTRLLLQLLTVVLTLQAVLVAADSSTRALLTESSSGSSSSKDVVSINLLHFNDVHNRIEAQTSDAAFCKPADDAAGKCFGGYARLRSVIRYAKSLDPSVLVLDAGDEFVGSMYDSLYKGTCTANLESLFGVDVMTLGNHEFDFGPSVLGDFIRRIDFPMLGACNVDTSREPALAGLLKKYVVKEVKGIKIAIHGILINETAVTSSPGPNVEFSDPFAGLAACIREANREHKGIHLHVGLTHIGYESDLLLATQVPGLDLIVGAHSHSFLYTGAPPLLKAAVNTSFDAPVGPYPTFVNQTLNGRTKTIPIVTAFYASRYVGALTLQVDRKRGGLALGPSGMPLISGKPLLLGGSLSSSEVALDNVTKDLVQLYSQQVTAYSQENIGVTEVYLNNSASRYSESLMGIASCDAFLNLTVCNGCHIDYCILNSGTIRADIEKGNVSVGQVFTVFPFSNTIATIIMNGSAIIGSLEWGTSALGAAAGTGRFAQVGGGLRYVYDGRRPVGQRILSVKTASGQDIDPCGQYTVLTNSYQATGGDGYAFMNDSPRLELYGRTFDAVLIDYVQKYTPITAQLDGRIIACQVTPDHPECAAAATAPAASAGIVTTTRNPMGSIRPHTMTLTPPACPTAPHSDTHSTAMPSGLVPTSPTAGH